MTASVWDELDRPSDDPAPAVSDLEVLAAEHAESLQAIDDGDTFGHLPESFWSRRPVLEHIRQAAHSRARSADAVLGCVLARVAALTPPEFNLPPLAGAPAPLSVYVAMVGPPGTGKSTAARLARELIPYTGNEVADDLPLGSGEGLVEAFFEVVDEPSMTSSRMTKVKRQTRYGCFMYLDEGQILGEIGSRRGSTLMPMLRTAWSGATLGTSNASIETRRKLAAGTYTLGLVIAFQPSMAADLLADSNGGTPQRFVFLMATDPNIPDVFPPWPGPLDWFPHPRHKPRDTYSPTLNVAPEIAQVIQYSALQRSRGAVSVEELDAHHDLSRLKVAGLLAILEKRLDVIVDDWDLAGQLLATSRAVRTTTVLSIDVAKRKKEESAIRTHVRRETAVVEDQAAHATAKAARAVAKHVHRQTCAGGCKRRCADRAIAGRDRQFTTVEDALDHAVDEGWIVMDDALLMPGKSRPT